MAKTVIREEMFPEIVAEYNSGGKTAAYDLIRSKYGLKQPYFVLSRIKGSNKYFYNSETDRFEETQDNAADEVFMSLKDLCQPSAAGHHARKEVPIIDSRPAAMEKLVHELISDRLLTISKYVALDTSTKTILIDQSSLSADGYRIVTH